jgi:hypothetical protein
MKINHKLIYSIITSVFVASLIIGCQDDPAYSADYDIKWPVPVITAISPKDTAMVSDNITITGTGLDNVTSLTIDNRSMTIVDKQPTALVVTLPRKFNTSVITMTNLYRQTVKSSTALAPKYPAIHVTTFPDQIVKDEAFVINGTNLDLATSVIVGSNVIAVSSTSATSLTVQTLGLKIKPGDKAVVEVKSNFSKVLDGKSNEIDVVE